MVHGVNRESERSRKRGRRGDVRLLVKISYGRRKRRVNVRVLVQIENGKGK